MSVTPKSGSGAKPWTFPSGSQWNRPPPSGQAPSARCGHTTTKAGWIGTKMMSDLYILEPESMIWTRPTPSGRPPRPRAGHTCTAIGPAFVPQPHPPSERIAALHVAPKGGDESSPRRTDEESVPSPSSSSTSSSTTTSNCTSISQGGNPSEAESSTLPPVDPGLSSSNGNVAVPSQRLLFFGGGDNDGVMNDLHLLEVDTLTWSPVFTAGSSPSPRSRHSATLVKSTLWVIGGLGEGHAVFNDVYTLNTSSMVWSKPVIKGTPMPPRWGHSSIRNGSLIIIFGGHNGVGVLNDLHILDTESNSWKTIEPMATSISPPLDLPPVAEIEGESSSPNEASYQSSSIQSSTTATSGPPNVASTPSSNSVASYSSAALPQASTTVSATPSTPTSSSGTAAYNAPTASALVQPNLLTGPMSIPPSPRCGHSANFVLMGRERKMVVFGGSNTASEVFNDTIVLDLDTWLWVHPHIKGSLPHERSVHTCNMVEDKLFVIGGIDSTRRFKDIYTLGLTNLVHVEDPAMGPLTRRPRRSSRASPRVIAGAPIAPPSPTPNPPLMSIPAQARKSNEELLRVDESIASSYQSAMLSTVQGQSFAGMPQKPTVVDSNYRSAPHTPTSVPTGPLSVVVPPSPLMSVQAAMITERFGDYDHGRKSPVSSPLQSFSLRTSTPSQSIRSNGSPRQQSEIKIDNVSSSTTSSSSSSSSMATFLTNLGLARLIPKFEAEEIDMSVLPYLTEENLEFLGVNTLGSRLRLVNAIQALKGPSNSKQGSNNTEALEASVERLVSTVLVATNTLTETMHFITTKLTNGVVVKPSSPPATKSISSSSSS